MTIFVVAGSLHTQIPTRFFNRILTPNDMRNLEDVVLQLFEGEVYIPEDEKIIAMMNSDPINDPLGIWRALAATEIDGSLVTKTQRESTMLEDSVRDYVLFLVLLRMAALHHFDIFLGSIINPLP